MPKTKEKTKKSSKPDFNFWFSKLSDQLERLIICHEKQLGGQVIQGFDSQKELDNREGGHA